MDYSGKRLDMSDCHPGYCAFSTRSTFSSPARQADKQAPPEDDMLRQTIQLHDMTKREGETKVRTYVFESPLKQSMMPWNNSKLSEKKCLQFIKKLETRLQERELFGPPALEISHQTIDNSLDSFIDPHLQHLEENIRRAADAFAPEDISKKLQGIALDDDSQAILRDLETVTTPAPTPPPQYPTKQSPRAAKERPPSKPRSASVSR